ncbi:MAG: DUF393 domain-containing protein [Chloroflexi bacterium]|nr:DUF393 domain-containing protein [Chloroflexota bacterium]
MARLTLVFDGWCGFCTRCVQWTTYLDPHRQVTWAASQEPGVRTRFGLSKRETDASSWAFDANGNRWEGPAAMLAGLAVALNRPGLLRLNESYGARLLAEWLYRWITEHRRLIPGVTPYCARPGHDCSET